MLASAYRLPSAPRLKHAEAPAHPTAVAMIFARQLLRVQRQWAALVMSSLTPELGEALRHDDASTFVDQTIWDLKQRVGRFFSARRLGDLFDAIGLKTFEHVRRELGRVLKVPLPERADPALLERFRSQCIRRLQSDAIRDLDQARDILDRRHPVGYDSDDLAKVLRKHFKRAEGRTPVFAQDQTFWLASIVAQERMVALGITEYTWITRRDGRVRHMHRLLDRKRFSFFLPPIVAESGARANPGQFPNCRCKAAPVISRPIAY